MSDEDQLRLFARMYEDVRDAQTARDMFRQNASQLERDKERLLGIINKDRDFIEQVSDRLLEFRAADLSPINGVHEARHAYDTLLEMIRDYERERWTP